MSKASGPRHRRQKTQPLMDIIRSYEQIAESIDNNDWDRALFLLDSLDPSLRNAPQFAIMRAYVHLRQKNYREVEKVCELLLDIIPEDPLDTLALIEVYFTINLEAHCLRLLRHFLRRWPDDEEREQVLDTLAEIEDRLDGYASHFGLSLEANLDALLEAEHILLKLNLRHYEETLKLGQAFLKKHPVFVPARNNLSMAYSHLGRHEEAVVEARKVLETHPQNIHALSNLVRLNLLVGKPEESAGYAAQLREIETESPIVIVKQLDALSFCGDDSGVLEVFRKARRVVKLIEQLGHEAYSAAMINHYAAAAMARLGRTAEARRRWDRALMLEPDLDLASENLEDLERPAGQRNGPYALHYMPWLPHASLSVFAPSEEKLPTEEIELEEMAAELRSRWEQHPSLEAIFPLVLERGCPTEREAFLAAANLMRKPSQKKGLLAFGQGKWGTDRQRMEALQIVAVMGELTTGPVELWLNGRQREVVLLGFEILTSPPKDAKPYKTLVQMEQITKLFQAKDYRRAELLARQALTIEPENPVLHYHLYIALKCLGKDKEAAEVLTRTHAAFPDYLFARAVMAQHYLTLGELEKAKETFQPLLERKTVHFTEFNSIMMAAIEIKIAEKDWKGAEVWLEAWESSDCPTSEQVASMKAHLKRNRDFQRQINRLGERMTKASAKRKPKGPARSR